MFGRINRMYLDRKQSIRDRRFINETAAEMADPIPGDEGDEGDLDELIDVDSIPEEYYNKIDRALDKIVNDEDYDDTELEEMLDDGVSGDTEEIDIDDDTALVPEGEIEKVVTEAAAGWL